MEIYIPAASDCMFFVLDFPDGIVCQLCIRQSSSASAASSWLAKEYGLDVAFRLKYCWYCGSWFLPAGEPKSAELVEKLRRRCTI